MERHASRGGGKRPQFRNADLHLAAWLPSRLAAKKSAFTLAEVLITLGIIGVVAALTLPNGVIVPPNLEATRNTNLANCKRKVVCDGEVNNSGHQECSTLIYKDGWKISPDYPW